MNVSIFKSIDEPDRAGIRPILNQEMFDRYKRGLGSVWFVEEITLSEDIKQWPTLDPNLQHFIKCVLSFFHGADKIVAENLSSNFVEEIPIMEAQFFYRFQGMAEDVHSDMYSTLVDAFITDPEEKHRIFNSVTSMPVIKAKADWMRKYSDRDTAPLAERIVAFAIAEGVFFSGSFCAIHFVRTLGLLPGLCFSNDFISRDEGEHCRFACLMYSHIKEEFRVPEERLYAIFREAVEVEKEFITEAVPVAMIGMNSKSMKEYIEFVADHWIQELGHDAIFNSSNPFPFTEQVYVPRKTNFFEKKSGEYQRANVVAAGGGFNLDSYF